MSIHPICARATCIARPVAVRVLLPSVLFAFLAIALAPVAGWSQAAFQVIKTLAGTGSTGYTGDGNSASKASLNSPNAVAVDSAGNVYIADTNNYAIRKVTPAGIITTVVGDGTPGPSGDGGPAISARLAYPRAVAVDTQGNIFIADRDAIRKVDTAGIIRTLTSTLPPGSGCSSACVTPTLKGGVALATDTSGNLYIADAVDNIVERLTPQGYLVIVAGTGIPGYSGDGGQGRAAQLNSPQGVAVDPYGEVFIADTGNHVIRIVYSNINGAIRTYAGNGTAGYAGDGQFPNKAEFISPVGLAVGYANSLYVSDTTAQVVRLIPLDGWVSTIAGNGTAGFSGDGGPATSASLATPVSLAMSRSGNLYIADLGNERVRVLNSDNVTPTPVFDLAPGSYVGTQTVNISDPMPGAVVHYTLDGTTPTASSVLNTGPLTVAATETIKAIAIAAGYVPSQIASATYTISLPLISTVAGNGFVGYNGDLIPALSSYLSNPSGAAVDRSGDIYFCDTNNQIVRKVTPDGIIHTIAGNGSIGYSGDGGAATSAQLNNPQGIAVDDFGNIYIADFSNYVIRKVDSNGIITTVAGNGTQGISADGGPATSAELANPLGVAVDRSGNLYIADIGSYRIRQVTSDGIINTVAGSGLTGYTGDGGAAISAELNQPSAVAVDNLGNLYIADTANNAVRKVTPAGTISTVAGTGTKGYSGDGGPAISAQLYRPSGLAVDASGNLYVLDYENLVIREVDLTGNIKTVAGNGSSGYSGDGGLATSAELDNPGGIALDSFNNLYIADSGNVVIRRVGGPVVPLADAPVFDPVSGDFTGTQTVSITDDTPGAVIHYTTDGTTPTAASSIYSGAITVSGTETVKAIAVAPGYYQSATTTAIYTLVVAIAPTIIWPSPGAIVYGTPLSSAQLNATASVPGTFIYSLAESPNPPALGYVLSLGAHVLVADFTPDDTVNYTTAEATVEIHVVAAGGPTITTVFGNGTQGYAGDGGPAASAELNIPFSVAPDAQGNVYIGDANSFVIRKVTPDGKISTVAGIAGKLGYTGDGGTATSAKISDPFAMAADAAGNLFFTDVDNNVVRKIDPKGIICTVAGTGNYGYSGDGGPATSANFDSPIGIALNSKGEIFISDSHNNVIRKVDLQGVISTVAGSYTAGYFGDGGSATSAQLYMPWGITFDSSDNLYIADYNNDAIRKIAADGTITTIAAYLYYPTGVAIDNNGNIFDAEPQLFAIRQIFADGTVSAFAGNYTQGYSGDGGQADLAQLNLPQGIATDPAGNLYIADSFNNVIRKVGAASMPVVPTPVFSPAGGAYGSPRTVSIVTSISTGASIYYTTDGSTPTTSSTLYTGPFTVSSSETIQAIAVAAGYLQSAVATASFTISKLPQTITFNGYPASMTYGASPITLYATASSGLPVSFRVVGPATLDGSVLTVTGAGEVQVFATQLGDDNYAFAPYVQRNFTVSRARLTIRANDKTIAYPASLPNFDFTTTGFVNGDTADVLQGAPVLSTTASQNPLGGTYSIDVAAGTLQALNYNFIFIPGTLTVTGGAAQTITFNGYPASLTYGASPTTLYATASSGLPVSFRVVGPVTLDGSVLTVTGAGEVQIFAIQSGNNDYAPAHYVQRNFTVSRARLTIRANDKTIAYPASLPNFDFTTTGFVNGDTADVLQGAPVLSTAASQNPPGGTYSIDVTAGTLVPLNYNYTFVSGTLTVTGGAAQTITFNGFAGGVRYGAPPITLYASASSGLPVSLRVSGPATLNGTTLTITGAGEVSVIATQLGDNDYAPAHYVQRNATVDRASLTVTANNKTIAYGQPLPVLDYSFTGFVNGDTAAVLQGTPSISTAASQTPAGGTYPINIAAGTLQAVNYNYSLVPGTLTVTQAPTVTALSASSLSITPGQSVTLTAQVTSTTAGPPTGTVSFYDGSTLLSTVPLTGGTASYTSASLVAGATHALTSTYNGDANFSASSSTSSISVAVAPLDFTITFRGPTRGRVTPGGAFIYQIVVDPIYGSYAGPVNVTVKGLPPGATATFTPDTIAANAGLQTITVTIQTLASTAMRHDPLTSRVRTPVALALLFLPLLGASRMRRRGLKLSQMLSLLLVLCGIVVGTALTGCGSTNGFFAQTPETYNIEITVTAGNVEHTATVTLEVQ
ncbi:MAG: chitobiase/beta-hexosaminidase C-terminal domain-containing protein [Terracidiphilus sp.]